MRRRIAAALLPALFLVFAFAGMGAPVDRPTVDSVQSKYGLRGGTITLPSGTTYYTGTVNWHGLSNTTIQGHPDGTTCLQYIGDNPIDAFLDIRGANTCTFKDFMIRIVKPGVYAALMVSSLPHHADHGMACSNCIFDNIVVQYDGGTQNTEVGISVGPRTLLQADTNNDWHNFRRCRVLSYNFAAYRVNGSQCHSLLFDQCYALNYQGKGQFGWAFEYGLFAKLYRCGGGGNEAAFLGFAGNAVQLVMDHCNSELDGALLHPFGSGASSFCVSIRDSRFALKQRPGDAARPAIHFRHAGPLTISDCGIEDAGLAVPQIVMNNPVGVVRIERSNFATRGDPTGKALVHPWGKDVDAKADACTLTVPVGDWQFLKVPNDPTKPFIPR